MSKKKMKREIRDLKERLALAEQRLVTAYNEAMLTADKALGTANTALEVAGNTATRLEKAMPRGVALVPSVVDQIDRGTAVPAQFKGVT